MRVQVNREEVALAEHCSKITGMMHTVVWLDVMEKVFVNSQDPGPSVDLAKNKHLIEVQLIHRVVDKLRCEWHPGPQHMVLGLLHGGKSLIWWKCFENAFC